AREPLGEEAFNPARDRLAAPHGQKAEGGDVTRRRAVGDFEQRGSLLADMRLWMVSTGVLEVTPLLRTESERERIRHHIPPSLLLSFSQPLSALICQRPSRLVTRMRGIGSPFNGLPVVAGC